MALGHLASKHRVGFSVLAFIVLNMAWSTVSAIIGLLGYPSLNESLVTVTSSATGFGINLGLFSSVMLTSTVWGLVLNLVQCVVYIALTNYILSRRLNLE